MRRRQLTLIILVASLGLFATTANSQTATPTTLHISASTTAAVQPSVPGLDVGIQNPELSPLVSGASDSGNSSDSGGAIVNRSLPGKPAIGPSTPNSKKAKSNPVLKASFDGIFHRQQRLANGGNQFSIEPPDQGLCAGNGFVLEAVNTVLNIYDTSGAPQLSFPLDLNTFYTYVAEFNRTTGFVGPEITDPSCYFDVDTQRWFIVVLTLDTDGNNLTGPIDKSEGVVKGTLLLGGASSTAVLPERLRTKTLESHRESLCGGTFVPPTIDST